MTLDKYLREHQAIDYVLHVTQRTDKKLSFTISPAGIMGDPVEITLKEDVEEPNPRVFKEDNK